MAKARVPRAATDERPLVGATMFGVTTPCVTRARERLEELGYEVLVFHATGTGGQSFEALATGGFLAGVLDATTTELADELVGGVLSAGPDRLEAVGARGHPAGRLARRAGHGQLRPARHGARALRGPQPLRAQPDGHAHAHDARGERRARAPHRRASSTAPPARPCSSCRCAASRRSTSTGQPFRDAEADEALFAALREDVDPAKVEVARGRRGRQRPRLRDRDGRPPARADPGGGDDAGRGARAAARAGRAGPRRSSAAAPAPACRRSARRPAASTSSSSTTPGRYRMAGRGLARRA